MAVAAMITTLTLIAVTAVLTAAVIYPIGHRVGWHRGYHAHRCETMLEKQNPAPQQRKRDAS
jgi:hypothetical protein